MKNYNEWLYNPQYINPQAYHNQQSQITQEYERKQQNEISGNRSINELCAI